MANEFRTCLVPSCNGNSHHSSKGARGFCNSHYTRLRRHGEPTAGDTYKGEVRDYYRTVVLNYEGDECLIWPYATASGRATMRLDGKNLVVSRLVCEDTHGAPPTPTSHAAHSCGNGHLGCVTKKHLSWKTPSENAQDKLIHGTHHRGERSSFSKLTEEEAREVLSLKGVESQNSLADRFGVCQQTISAIHRGKSWPSLRHP